jgi:predicted secreted protein
VEVVLPEAPTTGYLWRLVDPPPDVRELASEYRPMTMDAVAGGSGSRVFRLEAGTGRHVLEFRLQRPWEDEALERRVVTLVVGTDDPDRPPA